MEEVGCFLLRIKKKKNFREEGDTVVYALQRGKILVNSLHFILEFDDPILFLLAFRSIIF